MNLAFKALADPSRRHLLDRLHEDNGLTLNELCEDLDMTRQAVTKHLALLEKVRLVVIIWHGREKRHYLNPVPIQQLQLKKGLEESKYGARVWANKNSFTLHTSLRRPRNLRPR